MQVDSGEAARITQELSRLVVAKVQSVFVKCHNECPLADQPRVLRASLAVASALPCQAPDLALYGWTSTPQVR